MTMLRVETTTTKAEHISRNHFGLPVSGRRLLAMVEVLHDYLVKQRKEKARKNALYVYYKYSRKRNNWSVLLTQV